MATNVLPSITPLLHQSTKAKVGVASINENQEALFPIISANICGAKKLYKLGNVLFDSGAQISLIKQETAENRGLKGKDASITITEAGGQEENVKTRIVTCTETFKKRLARPNWWSNRTLLLYYILKLFTVNQ